MAAKNRLHRVIVQPLAERLSKQWIIVLQMGKVGSINVVESLKKRVGYTPVFHIHVLSKKQTERMRGLVELDMETRRHTALINAAARLRQKLTSPSHARKKIISLVRDPVAQVVATTMSEFVENNPGIEDHNIRFDPQHMPALHEFFQKRIEHEFDYVATWLDTELQDLFEINVLNQPFPSEKGYAIYQSKQAELLLIRTEDLSRSHREAFALFLGLEGFELLGANRAEDKGANYARAYQDFKNTVNLPRAWLEKFYSIQWVRHIYSAEEIERFQAQWIHRPQGSSFQHQ